MSNMRIAYTCIYRHRSAKVITSDVFCSKSVRTETKFANNRGDASRVYALRLSLTLRRVENV